MDLVPVPVILLIAANGTFLVSLAMLPGLRVWYHDHYRWYAALATLTALVGVLPSQRSILSESESR